MQIEEVDPTLKFERTPRQGAAISVFVAAVVALSTHASAQRTQKSTGAFAVPQTKFPGLGDARFLPSDVTKRRLEVPSDQAGKTRRQIGGPNGANVAEQVVDAYPTPAIDQRTPFVTEDEQFIYFAGASATSGVHQLFRLTAGSVNNPSQPGTTVPVALTAEAGVDHQFPVVNPAGNRIVFSKSSDGLSVDDPNKIWNLYASNIPASGTLSTAPPGATNLISLSAGRAFRGRTFTSVGRACWIGSNDVVFSGKLSGDANFHLFSINTTTLTIFQITNGNADERNPSASPDGRWIAFDSNAAPSVAGTGYTGGTNPTTETVDGNPASAANTNGSGKRNIFISGIYGANPRQFTSRYAGAADTNNVQPSWSSLRANPFTNAAGTNLYLVWASSRQPDVVGNPTAYTDGDTHDVYMALTSANSGNTILTELAPTVAQSAKQVTTVDPTYAYDDTYPVWSPVITMNRVAFQSDRTGNLNVNNFGEGFSATPGKRDLFLASALDVSAPTLLRYDTNSSTGEIVHINQGTTYNPNVSIRNRDQGLLPGQDVFFTVRADDREAGLKSIYLQFKNPNSYFQAAVQGGTSREHKEYRTGSAAKYLFQENNTPLIWQNASTGSTVGTEYEAEIVTLDGASYVRHRLNGGPAYEAGADDQLAFSGTNFPPLNGQGGRPNVWLELKPLTDADGNPVLPADGRGGVLYGATWKLPAEASDWYLDVVMYDNAVSPFGTGSSNWIIYDNVWGFSTALPPNATEKDILFVSDYTLGQKFFISRSGQLVGSPDNRLPIQFGSESYLTDSDMARYPSEQAGSTAPPAPGATDLRAWSGVGPWTNSGGSATGFRRNRGGTVVNPGMPHPLGVGSYYDELLEFQPRVASNGATYALPEQGRYSIWRVLSRGPVPTELLQAYLPANGTQPADTRAGERTARSTKIYNRLVIWSSPFSGNLFVGPGSVTDLKTQTLLGTYVSNGGRLMISGQDIGFALAGNGQANDFFTNTLKATYASDNSGGQTLAATSANRLTSDSWTGGGATSAYGETTDGGTYNYLPLNGRSLLLNTYFVSGSGVGDASRTADPSGFGKNDVVAPIAGAVADFNYNTGGAGIITSTNTNGGMVAYASFGIESISNDWYTWTPAGGGPVNIATRGQRAKLIANYSMGFRTATITGRLVDEQGSPVADALVRAIAGAETAPAAGTAITDAGGFFQIDGIDGGVYGIFGYKPGYYTQHTAGEVVHGTGRRNISLVMKRANPGKLTSIATTAPTPGGVLSLDRVTPIANIEVQARRLNPDGKTSVFSAISRDTSDARIPGGSYELNNLLIGEYAILCNAQDTYDTDGNLIPNPNYNAGYGTVLVTAAGQADRFRLGPQTTITTVNGRDVLTVGEDKNPQIDFYLPSAPQPITGRVINRTTGDPIQGAFVSAVSTETNAVVATGTTDADGRYALTTTSTPSTNLLPAGGYTLTGTALGFGSDTVQVSVQGNAPIVAADLRLVPQAPGSLSGNVTGILGNAIDGAAVKLYLDRGGVVETTPTYTTVTGAASNANGYVSNFRVGSVSPGKYVVVVEKDGLVSDPVQLVATVVTSVETRSVNFRLLPPRVYGDGLQLVSVPYQYTGTASRDIYGLTATGDNDGDGVAGTATDLSIYNAFNVADWTGVEYNTGANVPLNTGKGYFVKFGAITSVAKTGTPIPGNEFVMSLAPGWNLIGHPFTSPSNPSAAGVDLDIYQNASVRDEQGNVYSMTQAVQLNLVSGVLFGYTGSNSGGQYFETRVLKPWAGYWFRNATTQPLKLVLTYPTSRGVRAMPAKTIRRDEINSVVTRKIESKSSIDWRLQVAVVQGKLRDTDNTIGVAPSASEAFDNQVDAVKPPMVVGVDSVYLTVDGQVSGRSMGLADSIVGAKDDHRWAVSVKTSRGGSTILQWPSAGSLPRNLDLFVTDTVTGKRISVRSAGAYQFDAVAGGTRRFVFEAKTQSSGALAVSRVRTIPGATRSAGYRFGITTTVATEINVDIQTVAGRSVRSLITRSVGMRESTVAWDGRDADGRDIPAGAYVVVVRATDSDGRVVTHRVPMTTIR